MTITDLIPALKGHGRRRAVDEVDRLRSQEITLLTNLHAAGDRIAVLEQALAETGRKQAEAEEIVVQQLADLDDVTAERDALAEEVAALKRRFGAQLAAEANAARIDVPPMIRPVDGPEDEATAPIDVRPLWEALDGRYLGPVFDPGHVHAEGAIS
jgi:hypothetical protein